MVTVIVVLGMLRKDSRALLLQTTRMAICVLLALNNAADDAAASALLVDWGWNLKWERCKGRGNGKKQENKKLKAELNHLLWWTWQASGRQMAASLSLRSCDGQWGGISKRWANNKCLLFQRTAMLCYELGLVCVVAPSRKASRY